MARSHKCKWHGCDVMVESWQWGCSGHYIRLPAEIRDRMRNVPSHFRERKLLEREATAFSKLEEGIGPGSRSRVCQCGAPAMKRLPVAECIDCHKKRVFEGIDPKTGEKL